MTTDRVAAIVVGFGEVPWLERCVRALVSSDGVDVEVVVVDNGVDGDALEAVSGVAGVRVVDAGGNRGFGGACNLGARHTDAPLLAFVNPDAVVEPQALARLAAACDDATIGIASASLRLADRPELLNSGGGAIHFLGLGWADRFGWPASAASDRRDIAAASGAAMVMTHDWFKALGGFTEELFLYHEDADLSLRTWLLGRRVVFEPDAVVLHDYEFSRNPRKMYFLERNRLCLVLACFEAKTIALLAPVLAVFEVGIFAVAVAQGWWREKIDGWRWLVANRSWLARRRAEIQTTRVRSDREVSHLLAGRFTDTPLALPPALAPADALLGRYWSLVRRAL